MNILQQIVEHKKHQIAEAKIQLPESELRGQTLSHREKRPFFKRLSMPGAARINVIAEIKRASPSRGIIRFDLDVAKYASDYELGGASALSVLTDSRYFKGSIEDLKKARKNTSLPVLRKDFLISSYQIYESSVTGADAVLLIVHILNPHKPEKPGASFEERLKEPAKKPLYPVLLPGFHRSESSESRHS